MTLDQIVTQPAEGYGELEMKTDELSVSFMLNRHPLLGGDYYRAYRPAILASNRFGWATSVCNRMVKEDDRSDGRLGFVTASEQNPRIFFADVLVLRPVANWRLDYLEQAHAAGQIVIADLDDSPWDHEDLHDPELTMEEDYYHEWFPYVDAVLCSTKYLANQVREHGHTGIVKYAPNCYDPIALNADPKPSRRMGDRLWLNNRMSGDIRMYDEWVYPLLDKLDMSFTHIGAEENAPESERRVGVKSRRSFGWDTPRLIERPSLTIPEFAKEFERFSIGTIMMDPDAGFNKAKTETHAFELGAAGLPLVSASAHELYRAVPGTVELSAAAVEQRVRELLDPDFWWEESKRTKAWARATAIRYESQYMEALLSTVRALTK